MYKPHSGNYKKGNVPWHKGRTGVYSKKALEAMSEAKKGIHPWNRGKKNPFLTRRNLENNPMNRLEIRKKAIEIRKKNKKAWIKREFRLCECNCGCKFRCKINSKQRFISGHNSRNRDVETKNKMSLSALRNIERGRVEPSWKNCKRGWFYSHKNKASLRYTSSYELLAFQILETLISVKFYKAQFIKIPYIVDGENHNYIIDLYIEYKNGEKQIIEIKPTYMLHDKLVKIKSKFARKFARNNNMKFDIWTEKELFNNKKGG